MLTIAPASTIEEEVYQRVIAGIPPGPFYLRATHVQPRRNGDSVVRMMAEVDQTSTVEGTSMRVLAVYLNERFHQFLAISSRKVLFALRLESAPTINFIRVVDGSLDVSTSIFTPGGDEDTTSVVVTNYASIFYGAALYYYRNLWLPYVYQFWSLLSEWGTRLTEWQFKYHHNFPDTTALHALSVRLTSRAVWHEAPTTRGIQDLVSALCASTPVTTELSNSRPSFDLGVYPIRSNASTYVGHAFDCWLADLPSAKEAAFLRLASNVDSLELLDHGYGNTTVRVDGEIVELRKSHTGRNLSGVMQLVGPFDFWKAFVESSTETSIYYRFWGNPLDNAVVAPGLGAGTTFDTGTFDVVTLDSYLRFQEKWTGQGVTVTDDPRVTLDSIEQVAVGEGEAPFSSSAASLWVTTLLTGSMTAPTIRNTLHGGTVPDFSA